MNKELLQQALDALIGVLDDAKDLRNASISGGLYEVIECRDAIAALREAIVQPVQPAVAYLTRHDEGDMLWLDFYEAQTYCDEGEFPIALVYANPVQPAVEGDAA